MSDYATSRYGHAFAIGVTLNIIYVALEAGFGTRVDCDDDRHEAVHQVCKRCKKDPYWDAWRSEVKTEPQRPHGPNLGTFWFGVTDLVSHRG